MANKKLPAYFEKYFDEKFEHTYDKINGVKEDVCDTQKEVKGLKNEMKRMNGAIVNTKTKVEVWEGKSKGIMKRIDSNTKRSKRNKKRLLYLGIAIVLGTLFWVKESRDIGISVIARIVSML